MINRLELALMLLLMLGSLLTAVLVAQPRPGAAVAAADPLAVAEVPSAQAAEPEESPLTLPSFDAFDDVGFGLLPDLAPRFAPGQP